MTFDIQLSRELAQAFCASTGLGCSVTAIEEPQPVCACGYVCSQCSLCRTLGREEAVCERTHLYGLLEAERFGGQYIYFCRRGLSFFVSPIIGSSGCEARVTVGPFLMVDSADFCACELAGNTALAPLVQEIPYAPPAKVTQLSNLLFMATGFLNSVASVETLREQEAANAIQGQISAYILEIKQGCEPAVYPYSKVRALLLAMTDGNRPRANSLLNELLGHILLTCGTSLERIKAQINALLVVMTRTAIENGSDPLKLEDWSCRCYWRLAQITDMQELCQWLTITVNELITSFFEYRDARHADTIYRCVQYIRAHLADKLSLEELAARVSLSPGYLSKIFKEETGKTLQRFIVNARVQKSAELIRFEQLSLAEIAQLTGFQDQSYFTRVFQRAMHMTPSEYRRRFRK